MSDPRPTDGPSLVAVGGGSGLAVLLRGLKRQEASRLTAVVTVTDDGGSSGRLRRQFGVLPPGDIRNCIVALADDEDLLARLFQYRFPNGAGLTGHSFGNLFLTALTGITGDFYQAILTAESILSVRGSILPATLQDVRLRARGHSGRSYEGESAIGTSGEPMAAVMLDPATPPAFPPAVKALREADLILLGPGSLYTSILPNLLIPGIRHAIQQSSARVILMLNLMTQPGETDGFDGIGHLQAIQNLAGESLIDTVLTNSRQPSAEVLRYYADSGSHPVTVDHGAFESIGVEVVATDLLADGDLIRHDPEKLAAFLPGLLEKSP
ncbi:MAG: uridine diphosphate-N-acetylglucosamine-binding protein YvcK [Acidobacteriota bacterium]